MWCFGNTHLLSMKSSSRPCAKSAGQNEVSAAHSTSKSSVSKFARDFMLARIHPTAKRVAARGTPTYDPSVHLSTSSTIKSFKLANGESSTTPAIDGSSFAASSAVTAPIEVPHRPILPTEFRERRCDTTLATSVFSREPAEVHEKCQYRTRTQSSSGFQETRNTNTYPNSRASPRSTHCPRNQARTRLYLSGVTNAPRPWRRTGFRSCRAGKRHTARVHVCFCQRPRVCNGCIVTSNRARPPPPRPRVRSSRPRFGTSGRGGAGPGRTWLGEGESPGSPVSSTSRSSRWLDYAWDGEQQQSWHTFKNVFPDAAAFRPCPRAALETPLTGPTRFVARPRDPDAVKVPVAPSECRGSTPRGDVTCESGLGRAEKKSNLSRQLFLHHDTSSGAGPCARSRHSDGRRPRRPSRAARASNRETW